MKTTVDIPEDELKDVIRFTGAKTKRDAIVAAVLDYNRRRRLAELDKHSGTCEDLVRAGEIQAQRRRG
jgi:Bacterial antitoxin of type II TA system, VapB